MAKESALFGGLRLERGPQPLQPWKATSFKPGLHCTDADTYVPRAYRTKDWPCQKLYSRSCKQWWVPSAGTAAILAVAASKPVVTADAAGRIGVEKQMLLNLTCDHRIVYGADAAEFMLTLKKVIESPDQLIF